MMRFRILAVGAHARDVLRDERLFADKVFLPVRIVDATDDVEILDRPGNPVPPMYSPDELAVLRERESMR
jgi:hypothetical protein